MSDTRTDELIDRIAANEADARDFRAFEAQAQHHPQAWEHLARALRDELHLRASLQAQDHAARAEDEIARAMAGAASQGADSASDSGHGPFAPMFSFRSWSGWAAAAMIALAWAVFQPAPQSPAPDSGTATPDARFVALTAEDAFERYLELGHNEGRIITELPARMVEMESAEDGGMVVYYVRQLLERERVNEMYRYGQDELGRPMPVPIDFASFSVTDSSL